MDDTIYRQDAIDAVNNERCEHGMIKDILCDKILISAKDRIRRLPSVQHWIPCSERPPEEDEPVFVYLFNDSPYIAWFCGGRWHTEEFTLDKDEEPTAWMPLPKPYKEEE